MPATSKRIRTTFLQSAATVLFAVTSFASAAAWGAPVSRAADSAAIKQLFSDFNNSLNKHDARAMAALFTNDADFITLGGTTQHGRAAIEQHMQTLFAGPLKAVHRDVTLRGIRFLSPDIAAIDSNFVTTGVVLNGAEVPAAMGLYDWIVMKQHGHWMIAIWHESNLPQAR
jgi:uncharacterized protein (TIGR02246 family)